MRKLLESWARFQANLTMRGRETLTLDRPTMSIRKTCQRRRGENSSSMFTVHQNVFTKHTLPLRGKSLDQIHLRPDRHYGRQQAGRTAQTQGLSSLGGSAHETYAPFAMTPFWSTAIKSEEHRRVRLVIARGDGRKVTCC
mmetsp:Transcript_26697/g.87548  ORF Transcript_26697/g.87548 Transcript_26697/m.87548 type:complete len:140 (+) Transcript_26697:424-843(+)